MERARLGKGWASPALGARLRLTETLQRTSGSAVLGVQGGESRVPTEPAGGQGLFRNLRAWQAFA